MARTSILVWPVPKLASVCGAYTVTSLVPNMLRTAVVARTTAEPSGSADSGPRTSRFAAGIPYWTSAAHIAGSHARIAPALTWRETQAAAWSRTLAAWVTGPGATGRSCAAGEAGRDSAGPFVTSTARNTAMAAAADVRPIRRRRRRPAPAS